MVGGSLGGRSAACAVTACRAANVELHRISDVGGHAGRAPWRPARRAGRVAGTRAVGDDRGPRARRPRRPGRGPGSRSARSISVSSDADGPSAVTDVDGGADVDVAMPPGSLAAEGVEAVESVDDDVGGRDAVDSVSVSSAAPVPALDSSTVDAGAAPSSLEPLHAPSSPATTTTRRRADACRDGGVTDCTGPARRRLPTSRAAQTSVSAATCSCVRRSNTRRRTSLTRPGAAAASVAPPASVNVASWPRSSSGHRRRRTRPARSRLEIAWAARLGEWRSSRASSVIRSVCSGASDRATRMPQYVCGRLVSCSELAVEHLVQHLAHVQQPAPCRLFVVVEPAHGSHVR